MQTSYLKDLCYVITKGTTPTTLGMKLNTGSVNFIKVECLSQDGRFLKDKMQKIDIETHEKLKRSQLLEGDLLYSIAGSIGRMAFVDERILPANTNQAIAIIRPNLDLVDSTYLYYFLKDIKSQGNAKRRIVQSVQSNLSLGELSNLEVALPPRPIQAAIGKFMRSLDELILLNQEISSSLESIVQAAFKSWFIDFEPVLSKSKGEKPFGMSAQTAELFSNAFEDSALGLMPKGWQAAPIGKILNLQGGFSFKSSSWVEEGIPVVKIGSVKPGLVDLSQVSYVSSEFAEQVDSRFQLPKGSLVIGMTGYVGEVGLVPNSEFTPLLNQRVAKFSFEGKAWSIPFAYCLTRHPKFKVDVETASNGSAQANVSISDILNIQRPIPPSELVTVFDETFADVFSQILGLAEQNQTLEAIRDSVLPRLISGELVISQEVEG